MKKMIIITTFSALMGVVLAASAASGDCAKKVDGSWSGEIGSVSGSCPSQYVVDEKVSAVFNTYEYVAKDGTSTCNVNFSKDTSSSFSIGGKPQSITGTIYPYDGSMVNLSIGRTDNQSNANGNFEITQEDTKMVIHMIPADASASSDCAITFEINKDEANAVSTRTNK